MLILLSSLIIVKPQSYTVGKLGQRGWCRHHRGGYRCGSAGLLDIPDLC